MKIAVAVPVGLVLGLALGTGAGKMLQPAPVDSTHSADSTATAEDSHAPAATGPDTSHAAAQVGADTSTHTPTPPAAASTPAPPDHKRLAGILEKLPAKDAAVLVAGLSDDELAGTLRVMDVTKAAELIGALPATRGAAMGKRMLDAGGGH